MKKIMFNDRYYLTELTLSGKKTRATLMPASLRCLDDAARLGYNRFEILKNKLLCYKGDSFIKKTLPYQIGEVVAVAQNYSDRCDEFLSKQSCSQCKMYDPSNDPCDEHPGYRNKMFVKADMMLHHIRITDMKVERLQDISDEDCLMEGIQQIKPSPGARLFRFVGKFELYKGWMIYDTAQGAFAKLINGVSGEDTWESNPYVLAIYYELVPRDKYLGSDIKLNSNYGQNKTDI